MRKIECVVIAAGGLGTRVRKILGDCPKIIAPIDEIPFLHLVLDEFEQQGFNRFHLLLGYRAAEILKSVEQWKKKNQTRKNIIISATVEGIQMGPWNALILAEKFLPRNFLMTYGDVFPTVNLKKIEDIVTDKDDGCMCLCHKKDTCEFANVKMNTEGKIICYSNTEESDFVDIGAILLNKNIFYDKYNSDKNILGQIVENKSIKGLVYDKPSKHIGTPEAYFDFINWYRREKRNV